ncbi:MAG TPA: mercury resistance protein [Gemmatimonadales bacterium]|nr:mercury resistance protein [Gemmatimonadales bacterium]
MLNRNSCALTPAQANLRGVAWVAGAFLICPCHLPLTLALATTALAGTTAGLVLGAHWLAAGVFITLAWLAATWHGIRLVRRR